MSGSFCQKLELFPWRPEEDSCLLLSSLAAPPLPSLAEWVVENSPNPHLTSLDRTTLQPLTQAGPLQGSLSQILATFQSSLEQRVTALVTEDSCRGGGDRGSSGWRRGKRQPPHPNPSWPHPSHSYLSKLQGECQASAEITVLSDPGGI